MFENYSFFSTITHKKDNVTLDYSSAHHDDQMCFIPNCRYHFFYWQGLKECCENWTHSAAATNSWLSLYTTLVSIQWQIVAKNGKVYDIASEVIYFSQRTKGVDRMPSIARKRLLRTNCRTLLMSSSQKTKSLQTSGSVCAETIEQAKKTKVSWNWQKQ